jgi:hypothetical protein
MTPVDHDQQPAVIDWPILLRQGGWSGRGMSVPGAPIRAICDDLRLTDARDCLGPVDNQPDWWELYPAWLNHLGPWRKVDTEIKIGTCVRWGKGNDHVFVVRDIRDGFVFGADSNQLSATSSPNLTVVAREDPAWIANPNVKINTEDPVHEDRTPRLADDFPGDQLIFIDRDENQDPELTELLKPGTKVKIITAVVGHPVGPQVHDETHDDDDDDQQELHKIGADGPEFRPAVCTGGVLDTDHRCPVHPNGIRTYATGGVIPGRTDPAATDLNTIMNRLEDLHGKIDQLLERGGHGN